MKHRSKKIMNYGLINWKYKKFYVALAAVFVFAVFLISAGNANAQFFPSTSGSTSFGPMTNKNSVTVCPDGQYMAGLGRSDSDDNQSTQIYCAPAPLSFQSQFKSSSASVAFGSVIPNDGSDDYNPVLIELCPNGQYMAGIERKNQSDSRDAWQIYCAPAPSALQPWFLQTNASAVGGLEMSGTTLCPDGRYMAGLAAARDFMPGWNDDWGEKTQIYCASIPTGGIGQFCNFNGTCNAGLSCHPSFICIPSRSCELNPSGPEWQTTYKSRDGQAAYGYGTAVDLQGRVYIVGEEFNPGSSIAANTGMDLFLARYNSDGTLDRNFGANVIVRYDAGGNESGYGAAVDSAGNIYVAGRQDSKGGDMVLIKYDSSGIQQWTRIYDYAGGTDVGRDVAVDGSGNIFVVGHRQNSDGDIDMVLWIYDANGNLSGGQPTIYDDAGGNESGNAIAIFGNDAYVTGYQSTNGGDMFLRKYDASGNFQWMRTYGVDIITAKEYYVSRVISQNLWGGLGSDSDSPVYYGTYEYWVRATLGVDGTYGYRYRMNYDNPNDNAYDWDSGWQDLPASGYAERTGSKTVTDCNESWCQDITYQYKASLSFNVSGGVLTGCYNDTNCDTDNISADTAKADATDIGRGVAVSQDGGKVFVTGYQSTNGGDMFLRAYDAAGGSLWGEEYNSGGQNNDIGRAVVAGGADRVYVIGHQGTNNDDVFLREYFSSAFQQFLQSNIVSALWGDQKGYGIAINPSDELYTVGYQDSNGGEAFLSKYSCNAAPLGGGAAASGDWVEFFVTPGTSGAAPFDITAEAKIKEGSSMASAPLGQLIFEWNWGDDTATSTGQIKSHTYFNTSNSAISRILQLFARNYVTGETDTASTTISVYPDTPPTAVFVATATSTATQTSFRCIADTDSTTCPSPNNIRGPIHLLVYVDASQSTDAPPGKVSSFSWNWGDSTAPGSGVKTSHTYTQAGTYSLTLTVSDNSIPPLSTTTIPLEIRADYKCDPQCGGTESICAPGNQCVQCLEDYQCGLGYRCLGAPCEKGGTCADGSECPVDGRCQEIVGVCSANTPCADGSECPADGICRDKNSCVLAEDSLNAECYIEEYGNCTPGNDFECVLSVNGGKCVDPENDGEGICRYARCLNSTPLICDKDTDCARGDGICDNGACKYIYDCAYGPGITNSAPGKYATGTAPTMPAMPTGVLPEGEACTQPTPDAPINCEGINGCLYYNYNRDGTPIANSNNSVANCLNEFNSGAGCVYYQYYSASTGVQTQKANCLLSEKLKKEKKETAGIPEGCVQIARDKDSKGKIIYDYDCSAVDGCYYKSDGGIDCTYTYTKDSNNNCTQTPDCVGGRPIDAVGEMCVDTTCFYQYEGNGCIYEPNPEGAIFCPGATKPALGGKNYVSCLLNPDAQLPWYLRDRTATTTEPCDTNANCPEGQICLYGACYSQCQIQPCNPGDTCSDGSTCPASGECNTNCASGETCYIIDNPSGCIPGTYCPNGALCPANGICPETPFCLGAQPKGNLPFGTSTTTISMRTTQDANCRYSLIEGTPYAVMTDAFTITGSTAHSAEVAGLMPLPSLNAYFVECQNSDGNITPACKIEFGVGGPCTEDSQCDGGLSCINGYCQLPYCNGAQPPPGTAFPSDTLSVGIGLNTDVPATCRYSQTLPDDLLSKLDQFLGMPTLFNTLDGVLHTDTVTSGLVTGNNSYYVLCQESAPPQDITRLCQLSFNIGVCNEEFKCANGWQCVPNIGNGVCVPPPCSNVSALSEPDLLPPDSNNSFSATTTSITLQAATDEPANCAYGDSSSIAFDSMMPFAPLAPASGQAHSAANVSIKGGYNTKYVKCQDADGTDVCSVSFRVGQECGAGIVCPAGQECRNGFCAYPVCDNAYPANLPFDTTETTMGLTTDVDTECRQSKTTYNFDSMTVFDNTGGQAHSTFVTDLKPRLNRYLVSCRDNALPNKIKRCEIPIYVGNCAYNYDCELGFGCNLGTGECTDCDDYAPNDPNRPPECQPWCERFPWLCNPGGGLGPGNVSPLDGGVASCSFMGITFFGDAVDDDGSCDIVAMILAVLSWIAWVVALLAVLSGLRAAYLYITAMGNEKRLNLAKMYLIYTTIGVVVAIISFGLVAIARALLGI